MAEGNGDPQGSFPKPKIDEEILKKYKSLDEVLGTEDAQAFELSRHLWALKGFSVALKRLSLKIDRIIRTEESKVRDLLYKHRVKLSSKQQEKLQEIFDKYSQYNHAPTMKQVLKGVTTITIKAKL